jgi:hypothetical protein
VTMFGEGNARVHFKVSGVGGWAGLGWWREWDGWPCVCVSLRVCVVCACFTRSKHTPPSPFISHSPPTQRHTTPNHNHHTPKARGGEGTAEEWLSTSSARFLSMEQVTQALSKFDFSHPYGKGEQEGGGGGKRRRGHKAAGAAGAVVAAGDGGYGDGQYPYCYPYSHSTSAASSSYSSSHSSWGSSLGSGAGEGGNGVTGACSRGGQVVVA